MKKIFLISCFAATMMTVTNCAKNPVTGKSQLVLMSEAQEIQMGQEADPQIIQQFGLYEGQDLQRYINDMGQQIVKISHRPNITYNFRVINSEVLNAFAVPGGYVYFTRGIMAHLNDEAQFAGVLGHEIGHVTARHTVSQQRNAMLSQIGLIAGMVLAPGLAQFGDLASQGLGLLLLKNGRDAERQADELGVEYSTKLGYDAHHMATFFQTLERQGEQSGQEELPTFLSTHPNPGDRYNTVNQLATQWLQKNGVTNPKVNREAYLRRIEGLIYGEDPKEGYFEGGVFYHPVLRFQLTPPSNWAYANSPTQVQFASRDGKAMMMLTMAQGNSTQEAANAFVQQYKAQVSRSGATTVNGMSALAVEGSIAQQQGGTIAFLTYFIQYNNAIYQLLGVSGAADYPAYANVLASAMSSFRQLTDASKLNRQAERIHIRSVATAGTVEQALRALGVPQARLAELALVNGVLLTDRVVAGTQLKVVGP
jgi:predicted Zn-dependent protease